MILADSRLYTFLEGIYLSVTWYGSCNGAGGLSEEIVLSLIQMLRPVCLYITHHLILDLAFKSFIGWIWY